MANYGIIQNGEVINAIVADSQEIANSVTSSLCVELPDGFGIGDLWDGEKLVKRVYDDAEV